MWFLVYFSGIWVFYWNLAIFADFIGFYWILPIFCCRLDVSRDFVVLLVLCILIAFRMSLCILAGDGVGWLYFKKFYMFSVFLVKVWIF